MEFRVETAVRVRSVSSTEENILCVESDTLNNNIKLSNNQCYPVSYALPINCCQSTVFNSAIEPFLNYFLEGCDVSVVTFGQSRTGKTFTLYGPGLHYATSESEHGVVPRFIRDTLARLRQLRDKNRTWSVHITWSQICGDSINDLLGVGIVEIEDILDAFQLIQIGLSNLTVKCTHTLFTITLEQQLLIDGFIQHKMSTASFADLACCEKIMLHTGSDLLQNGPHDKGLQALQNCIMSLTDPCVRNYYLHTNNVPYNQSVLTTLLRDSFGGRAKTLLLCCISPLIQDFGETLYTLEIAARANLIKNLVTVNSYISYQNESTQSNSDLFGLQFAANQLLKLVVNAEELFQKLMTTGCLKNSELDQISQWLILKQECEECLSNNSEPHRSLEIIEEEGTEYFSEEETIDTDEGLAEEDGSQLLTESNFWKRPLTLNELLEEAQNLDVNDDLIPSKIVIFPPDNNDITDEDSGDESNVSITNLPGRQLRAHAEVNFDNIESDSKSDSEDDLPLSRFVKRKKMCKPAKEKNEFSWTKNDITSDLPLWDAVYGPKQQQSPVHTFFSFFDDEVINLLVSYTNLYASGQNRDADVTTDEMRCFIGILLLSGYNCVSRREMYWENSPDTNNRLVCNAMTRNRFRHIMQNLHCCDNANLAADDRFAKLRLLISVLNKKFMDMAPSAEHHSVDESMVPYYGRHPTKQFICGKPIRWGYKLWTATNRLGYIEWFEPYQGANNKLSDEYKALGLGASVVLEFVDTLKASENNMNYHIFFDNLFTSLPLLSELKSRGVKGTGTIRENRLTRSCQIVSSNEMKKQPQGNFDYSSTVGH